MLMIHFALLFAHYDSLFVIKVLLFSHKNLQPNAILSVDCCQRCAKWCDSLLSLFYVVLKQVSIDYHVDDLLVLLTICYQHTDWVSQSVVDCSNTTRDDIETVLDEDNWSEQDRLNCVLLVVRNEGTLDQAFEGSWYASDGRWDWSE